MRSNLLKLEEIKSEVTRLARRIGASDGVLPTFGLSEGWSARPHIEVDGSGYHYVVEESGHENSRLTTPDLDELMYNVFANITFGLALDYWMKHSVERQDSRSIAFQRQVELLLALSPEWAKRRGVEQAQILRDHPFDDDGSVRAKLTKELRDQGHTPENARQLARDKYPEPSG